MKFRLHQLLPRCELLSSQKGLQTGLGHKFLGYIGVSLLNLFGRVHLATLLLLSLLSSPAQRLLQLTFAFAAIGSGLVRQICFW